VQRLPVTTDALTAQLSFLRAWPAVNHSAIRQRQNNMEAVVVLLVGDPGPRQPRIKAQHGFGLLALLVAFWVGLATFPAAVSAAAPITNVLADVFAATHAVASVRYIVFVEAHGDSYSR